MSFQESIRTCLTKYADFTGTASRAEYWWFVLFVVLAEAAAAVLAPKFGAVIYIGTLLPVVAAGARRLHETGRSGWLQLLGLVPVAGLVIVAFFLAQEREPSLATS